MLQCILIVFEQLNENYYWLCGTHHKMNSIYLYKVVVCVIMSVCPEDLEDEVSKLETAP